MKHDFSITRFRASQAGKLMTDSRSKSEAISETTKEYLREAYINIHYGRSKDIVSKFIQKGNLSEEDSLTILSRVEKKFFTKNEDHFSNDFLKGTPDIIEKNDAGIVIFDTKTSWDIFTYFKAKHSPVDKMYYWQLQSYMDLTGSNIAYLVYCLVNTPEKLIESEKRKFAWNAGIMDSDSEISQEALASIEKLCIYDDIPIQERVHKIMIERNQDDINRLHERVIECRKWMNENF